MNDRPSTIETDRLVLRPFETIDTGAYAAVRAKAEVVRYLPGGEEAALRAGEIAARTVQTFASLWGDQDGPGYGPWAMIDRQSGALIGHVGLRLLDEMNGETEILYMLDSAYWGRGLATEGALAARDYGFDRLRLNRLIALALPENKASQKVMQKIGMTQAPGLVDAFGLRLVFSSMTASDPR